MCGIIGIIGQSDEGSRREALALLKHRGPDGEGEYQSGGGAVWLGHRRLVIGEDAGGEQPLSNEDGTIWIVHDGGICNSPELRRELESRGHRLTTRSDAETIVHAYEEWGEECVERFIGSFAFALWDERKQRLFCARDRLGAKPFYYWRGKDRFVFSSEIKAILATGYCEREVSREALEEYVTFQTTLDEKTLFNNIYRLLPGCSATVNASDLDISCKRYWDLHFHIDYEHNEHYFVDRLRSLLRDAVGMSLCPGIPMGATISGGLDSSAVVCLASDLRGADEPLVAFTGAFREGADYDETKYARLIAGKTGARHHVVWMTAEDFQESLPKIIYFLDEPVGGPGICPQYMVAKVVSDHVKVVLAGEGGDEFFGGYARYLVGYLEECLKGAIEETEDTARYVATLQTIIPNLPMLKQYIPMLRYFWADGLFESQEKRYFRLMDRSAGVRHIYNPDIFHADNRVVQKFSEIFNGSDAESFLNRIMHFDLRVHLPALLRVDDGTTAAWGLDSRAPLLDYRIAELMASILPVMKLKGGQSKYLFRQAIQGIVPDEILQRKDKKGFPVPLHLWYKNQMRDFIEETLFSKRAVERGIFEPAALRAVFENEQDFSRVIWGALCLELWFRTFLD